MMKLLMTSIALSIGLLSVSGAAQAAAGPPPPPVMTLIDRGGGLIYDTVLNVTWLKDANYAKTSGYDADGLMTWSQATTWASNLSYYDSVRNVTYTDWRLPTLTDTGTSGCNFAYSGTDCGYSVNTATGEMAHLFYDMLQNIAGFNTYGYFQPGGGLVNSGPFINIQASWYWYGTEYAPNTSNAWDFLFASGDQYYNNKVETGMAGWAVRPGDVAAVPVPAAAWLLGSGLLALAGVTRRQR